MVYLEGAYKMVNDGFWESVLQNFEGIVFRTSVFILWVQPYYFYLKWVGGLGL